MEYNTCAGARGVHSERCTPSGLEPSSQELYRKIFSLIARTAIAIGHYVPDIDIVRTGSGGWWIIDNTASKTFLRGLGKFLTVVNVSFNFYEDVQNQNLKVEQVVGRTTFNIELGLVGTALSQLPPPFSVAIAVTAIVKPKETQFLLEYTRDAFTTAIQNVAERVSVFIWK